MVTCKLCLGPSIDPVITLCENCRKRPLMAFLSQVRKSPFPGSGWVYFANVLAADGKSYPFGPFDELEDAMDFCEDNGVAIDWR